MIEKIAKRTPAINDAIRIPILTRLFAGFASFITYSSSRYKIKSRGPRSSHITQKSLCEQKQPSRGSNRPLSLFVFALVFLVQERLCADFVQQKAQFISLILRTAFIALAFR
jgi:hypothetical protein